MKTFSTLTGLAALLCLSIQSVQADSRGPGWEFGVDALYQSSQDIAFNGGSAASLDDDFGLRMNFGYRFSDRLELQLGIDWQNIDYDVTIASSAPDVEVSGRGSLEAFTPRASLHFNFMEGPFTPYVNAGIGYSFIDTNIPDAPPQTVCWWDPWWGYVCSGYQSTRNVDEFTYQVGAGIRWDMSPGYSLRFGYEKQWMDLGEATSTPDFDQFRLGVVFRY